MKTKKSKTAKHRLFLVMLILNMHRKISFVMVKEANKFHCFYGWKEYTCNVHFLEANCNKVS